MSDFDQEIVAMIKKVEELKALKLAEEHRKAEEVARVAEEAHVAVEMAKAAEEGKAAQAEGSHAAEVRRGKHKAAEEGAVTRRGRGEGPCAPCAKDGVECVPRK